jgi:Tol biopolymer transport system component
MRETLRLLLLVPLGSCALPGTPPLAADPSGTQDRVSFEVSEGTKLAFDVSPDGRTVAFDLLGQIWLVSADGGPAKAVTDTVHVPAEDLDPSFSPDGKWIAFVGRRPGGRGLWLLPAGGGEARRLTAGESAYADPEPAWSPDSSKLVFVRGGALRTLDVASGSTTELRVDGLPEGPVRSPAWSPDGRRIAFVHGWARESLGVGPDPGGRLYVVPSEGGTASPLLADVTSVSRPAYAPDGERLAYFTSDADEGSQLWVSHLTQRSRQRVRVDGDPETRRLRWFPDGRALLYVADGRLRRADLDGRLPREIRFAARVELLRERTPLPPVRVAEPGSERPARGLRGLALAPDGRSIALLALQQLWVFPPGTEPRAVAEVPLDATGLSWSPDGEEVAWSAGPVNAEDLFATEVRSGRTRRLTQLPGREARPSWSPDGRSIAFIYAETSEPTFAPQRLRTIPARTETVRTADETRDLAEVSHWWHRPLMFFGHETPQWSPDSRGVLLFERRWYDDQNRARLATLSGEAHDLDRFPPAATQIQWAPNGTLVYVDNDRLFSIALDPDRGATGEPILLWDGPAIYPSVSRDGSVLFVADDGLCIRRPDGRMQRLGWPLRHRAADAPPPMLVQDVRIVSGSRAGDGRSDILIRDGRIRRIASRGVIPVEPGVRIVPGGGRWVIPGLIDAAASLSETAQLRGFLYHGITTVRDIASQMGPTAALRDAIEAGVAPGPRIFFPGLQFFPGAEPSWVNTGDLWHVTAGDAGAVRGLALAKGFGATSAYLYQPETLEDGVRFIRLAHETGFRVTYSRFPPLSFVAAGLDQALDVPLGERVRDDVVQLFETSGVGLTTDVTYWSLFGKVQSDPGLLDEPETAPFVTPFLRGYRAARSPRRQAFYEAMADVTRRNIERLRLGGVATGVRGGGGQPLAWELHAEMEERVGAGVPPRAALDAATLVNARLLGAESDIGSIEEGRVADLVLLDGDPLGDIRNTRRIHAVIQGGRLVDREALLRPSN